MTVHGIQPYMPLKFRPVSVVICLSNSARARSIVTDAVKEQMETHMYGLSGISYSPPKKRLLLQQLGQGTLHRHRWCYLFTETRGRVEQDILYSPKNHDYVIL